MRIFFFCPNSTCRRQRSQWLSSRRMTRHELSSQRVWKQTEQLCILIAFYFTHFTCMNVQNRQFLNKFIEYFTFETLSTLILSKNSDVLIRFCVIFYDASKQAYSMFWHLKLARESDTIMTSKNFALFCWHELSK